MLLKEVQYVSSMHPVQARPTRFRLTAESAKIFVRAWLQTDRVREAAAIPAEIPIRKLANLAL